MNTGARYFLLVLGVVISLHYLLSFTHEEYGRITSMSNIASHFKQSPTSSDDTAFSGDEISIVVPPMNPDDPDITELLHADPPKANATFVILARNSDVDGTVKSIRDIEDRFNHKYQYPYVFLNEVEFSDDFKRRISNIVSTSAEFGVIPHDHWYQPDWIDEAKATSGRDKMVKDNIIYGGSVSYRNMCRFNSGFFYRHDLLQKYRWYWRIEPDIHFHCNINFDPFLYMENNNKTYGFTITMYEFEATIPTLWGHVKDFIKLHPEYLAKDNSMDYMSDNNGETYNRCHFWSNFEIADLNFWRGEAYQAYFNYLDAQGGFYYERWGDAPVHSIGAALFASKDQIHFFNEIGYEHNPYTHCPRSQEAWEAGQCGCNPAKNFDYDGYSCMKQWERIQHK
ncbi:glycosyltransferase 15 family protein [Pleurotus pulmonarius]|nr:alpha 1,2-mannosyltransferase 2.4.1 [Pleurotus pulmonarius]